MLFSEERLLYVYGYLIKLYMWSINCKFITYKIDDLLKKEISKLYRNN